jgi:hypothetical protein
VKISVLYLLVRGLLGRLEVLTRHRVSTDAVVVILVAGEVSLPQWQPRLPAPNRVTRAGPGDEDKGFQLA